MNCSSDLKNFKSFSRSLEQFFLTVGQNNFGNKIPFLTGSWRFLRGNKFEQFRTQIGTNNWDLETYKKSYKMFEFSAKAVPKLDCLMIVNKEKR